MTNYQHPVTRSDCEHYMQYGGDNSDGGYCQKRGNMNAEHEVCENYEPFISGWEDED